MRAPVGWRSVTVVDWLSWKAWKSAPIAALSMFCDSSSRISSATPASRASRPASVRMTVRSLCHRSLLPRFGRSITVTPVGPTVSPATRLSACLASRDSFTATSRADSSSTSASTTSGSAASPRTAETRTTQCPVSVASASNCLSRAVLPIPRSAVIMRAGS